MIFGWFYQMQPKHSHNIHNLHLNVACSMVVCHHFDHVFSHQSCTNLLLWIFGYLGKFPFTHRLLCKHNLWHGGASGTVHASHLMVQTWVRFSVYVEVSIFSLCQCGFSPGFWFHSTPPSETYWLVDWICWIAPRVWLVSCNGLVSNPGYIPISCLVLPGYAPDPPWHKPR